MARLLLRSRAGARRFCWAQGYNADVTLADLRHRGIAASRHRRRYPTQAQRQVHAGSGFDAAPILKVVPKAVGA
ncbi:hypothetical protein [uncultured Phenylobacterium sp.]|uniref:hypothetical protein n=1 Tax=uncultured Phenylobacterium sp. TaxID=349273 RepID=UPI0026013BAF|nr:hypothetical protein [uncultured Phenylobacterium sp.]